jgi:stage III sporulation protein SpoIIIAA
MRHVKTLFSLKSTLEMLALVSICNFSVKIISEVSGLTLKQVNKNLLKRLCMVEQSYNLAHEKLRQEDSKSKTSLGYIARSCFVKKNKKKLYK